MACQFSKSGILVADTSNRFLRGIRIDGVRNHFSDRRPHIAVVENSVHLCKKPDFFVDNSAEFQKDLTDICVPTYLILPPVALRQPESVRTSSDQAVLAGVQNPFEHKNGPASLRAGE